MSLVKKSADGNYCEDARPMELHEDLSRLGYGEKELSGFLGVCMADGKGFVAINNSDNDWQGTFKTSLGDGRYCDVITGSPSSGSCSGGT